MKTKNKDYIAYILSFLLPLTIAILSYLNVGIYPGSTSTVLIYDMRAQLLALYGYLSNFGPGYDNLFYSMSGALGGGFFGTLALYISPFDFIYCLVPTKYLPDAIYLMTVFKISLSGLTCCVFLKRNKSFELGNAITVTLASCYALMTYNFMYAMSPMWLDAVMLLPLLALMLEKIIDGKRSGGFVFLMAFCIISDYYIGYMCAIALTIYFVFRLFENGDSFKKSFRKFLSFAVHGMISGGISAFVIIPVILDFGRGKMQEDQSLAMNHILIKNSLLDILSSFKTQSYATLDYTASPNIFCGTIVLVLALVWLIAGKKNIRARIATLCVLAVYFISFIFGPIDRIWHGFRDPVGFPVRYAFTFVFFMICFAARGYKVYKSFNKESVKGVLGLVGALFVFYTYIELCINGGYILSRLAVEQRFANRDEYNKICEVMTELLPDNIDDPSGYGRIYRNFNFSRYDGALYGYDGFARFSSSYNYNLDDLLNRLGVAALYHTVTEKGINSVTASLLNIKYYISYYRDAPDTYNFLNEYRLYKLYENKYCLPLAFGVEGSGPIDSEELTEDPFYNINLIYRDLSGDGNETEIFKTLVYERVERDTLNYHKKDTVDSEDFTFYADADGLYYFYSDDTEPVPDYAGTWSDGNFSSREVFADSYVDGEENETFRNDEFSYITSAGNLTGGREHVITLDSSLAEIGDTWIYYLDESAFEGIAKSINSKGFEIVYIGSKGISVKGGLNEDGYVFLSLPYENGYKVCVDGKDVDYFSYRNALLLVPVTAGEHEITIKYVPPGLYIGLLITLISICLMVLFVKGINKKDKSSDSE